MNLIFELVLLALSLSFGVKQLSPKEYKNTYLIILSFIIIGTSIAWVFVGNKVIFLIFTFSVLYLFLNKEKRWYSIMAFFFSYVILCLCDQILTTLFVRGGGISYQQLENQNSIYLFFFIILEMVLANLTLFIIGTRLKKSFFPKFKSYSRNVFILISIYIIVMLFVFVFNVLAGEKIGYSEATLNFNLILFGSYFVVSSVILFYLLKASAEKARTAVQIMQYDNLSEYTKNIERMYSELRNFKHDYINIMTSMVGFLEEKDYEGLEVYFNEHIMPLNNRVKVNNFKLNQLMNVKHAELKGLLSVKLIYASELGIDVEIEVYEEIEKMNIDVIDISRILGVYLDNATEAALESNEPKIALSIIKEKDIIVIIIANSFIDRAIPIHKMFEQSFSSKGEARGIGLYSVSQILKGYSNVYRDTYIEKDMFYQKLIIE